MGRELEKQPSERWTTARPAGFPGRGAFSPLPDALRQAGVSLGLAITAQAAKLLGAELTVE